MSNYTTNITSFVSLSRLGQQFGISDRISLKSILTSNVVSSAAKYTSYTNSTPPDIYFNNVNLLLHFDNDFKDYSINSSTISLNSPANIASGGAYSSSPTSLNIPGNGSVTTPTSTLFSLGSASFTFDLWIKINTGITQPVCFVGNGSSTATFGKNNWSFGTYYTGGSHYLSFTIYNISQTYTSYVSSDAITLGTWYNVAFQRNNSVFSLFLNGRNVGAFNWTGTIDGMLPSSLNIGSDGCLSTTNYMNGNIDDVRFTYGVARYNVTTSTMKLFPLDTLSVIAQQSYVGLYAVRRLLSNYSGPVITVRRNNDATGTALQDFYSDPNGNLYTLPFTISVVGGTVVTYISNGITFATWLTNNSATTGYVTILYDQSGIGNNAIQNTTTLQPVINASKYIDFAAVSGSYLSLPTGTIPLNSTYTVSLQHGTITYVSGSYGILGGGSTSASSANNFKITTGGANAYLNSWISNEYGNYGTYAANNRITWIFGTQGVQASYVNTITSIPISIYVNGTVQNSTTKTTTWTPSASADYIGRATDVATNMNGQLYWLTLFNMALSSADQTIIEANNISSTFVSSPTGYVSSVGYTIPTTNYSNSVNLITYKNILNLYNPICALDANNVGVGSTIWTDSSGTGNNFNITATGRTSYNGTNCITGNISRGSDLTVYNSVNGGSTLITFALPNTSTTGFRYLYKSSTGYSPTIINTGTNNVGIYTSSVFTSSGLDISTLPTYNTNFNMIVTKSQSTLTQIKYNNISACNYTAVTSTTPNPFGINAIGYDGSSAGYFGNIGLVLMYNSLLSESAINDIYTTFAPRFQYIMPPINTNLVGYYTGESWTGTRWLDYSGNNNAATTITNPSLIYTFSKSLSDSSGNKYQSLNGFKYLGGDSTTKITFPDFALNTSSTIFWVARYAGSIVNSSGTSGATGNRKCIFTNISTPPSWISGFLNGASGVCAHNFTTANITNSSDVYANNWIIGCDQYKTGNVSLFRGNSTNLTVAQMSTGSTQPQFGINVSSSDQASDWLVASVLVYNIALTSSQINTIEFWLANKYGLTKSINIHPLDRTSVSSYSSCVGAYSFYRLSTSYSGPLFNIRRSNDNSIEDIYGDINGVLGVSINGTGQSLSSWLNGNKGYITIWYDQSGQGNHAVQTNQQMQPLIDLNNLFVDFSNQLISSPDTFYKRIKLPDGTVPSGSSPYTIIAKHYNGSGAILGSGTGTTNLNVFAINGSAYKNYWTTSDSITYGTYALGNTVAFTYDGSTGSTSKKVYTATNAATSVSAVSGVPTVTTAMNNATANNYIGYGDSITNNYFNGGLYYLYIFKNTIPLTDINIVQSVTTTASLITSTVVQAGTTVNLITNSTPVSYTSQIQLNIAWGAFTNNTVYVIVAWTSSQNNGTSGTPISGSTTLTTSSQFNVTGLYAGILYNFTITPYNKYNIAGTVLSGFSQTMASPSIIVAPAYSTSNGTSFQTIFTVSDGCYYVNIYWIDTVSPFASGTTGIVLITSLGGTPGGTACTYTTPSNLVPSHTYTITYTLYNFNQSATGTSTSNFLVGQPYTMPSTYTPASPTIAYNQISYTNIKGGQDIALGSAGPANFTVSAKLNNTGAALVGTINGAASYTSSYVAATGMNTIVYTGLTANSSYTLYLNLNNLSTAYYPTFYNSPVGTFYTASTITATATTLSTSSIRIDITGGNYTNYSISGTGTGANQNNITTNPLTITALSTNILYTYTITSYNQAGIAGGTASPSPSAYTLPTVGAAAPTFGTITTTSIVVNFTAGTATSYRLSYSTGSTVSGSPTTVSNFTSGSTVSGLSVNQQYSFLITPIGAVGALGTASSTGTTYTYYNATISASASPLSTSSIRVTITGGTYTNYSISGTGTGANQNNITTNPLDITSLSAASPYTYTITSYNQGGVAGGTASPSATTYYNATITASATATSSTTIRITVTGGTYNSYNISGNGVNVNNSLADATGLSPNQSYQFTVTSYNQGGVAGQTASPSAYTYTTLDSVSVWYYNGSGNSVNMYYSISGAYNSIASISGGGTLDSGNGRVTGLSAGSTYNITFTVNGNNGSPSRSTGNFTIPNPTVTIDTSQNGGAGLYGLYDNGSSSMKIWFNSASGHSCIAAYRNDGSHLGYINTTSSSGNFIVNNLSVNTQYTIYLIAYSSNDRNGVNSSNSNQATRYSGATYTRNSVSYYINQTGSSFTLYCTVNNIGGSYYYLFPFITNGSSWYYGGAMYSGNSNGSISSLPANLSGYLLYVWSANQNGDYGQQPGGNEGGVSTGSASTYTITNISNNNPSQNSNNISVAGPSSFTINVNITINITYTLIGGGGGGGGGSPANAGGCGGGGGAGKYIYTTATLNAGSSYNVSVGGGGGGGSASTFGNNSGDNGGDTIFQNIATANGGIGGSRAANSTGGNGGSSGNGFSGGNGYVYTGGGGGAGATQNGANGGNSFGGNGGTGVSAPQFGNVWCCGGGGGGITLNNTAGTNLFGGASGGAGYGTPTNATTYGAGGGGGGGYGQFSFTSGSAGYVGAFYMSW